MVLSVAALFTVPGCQVKAASSPLNHKALAGTALLRRAGEKLHGARAVVHFQIVLQAQRGGKCAGAQQVVPAAVTGAVLHQRLFLDQASLLAQAGQGVKLAQKADDRPAGREQPWTELLRVGRKQALHQSQISFIAAAQRNTALLEPVREAAVAAFAMTPRSFCTGVTYTLERVWRKLCSTQA